MKYFIFFFCFILTVPVNAQLVSKSATENFKTYLPRLDDERLDNLIHSDKIMFYNSTVIPSAYQDAFGGSNRTTFFSKNYNVSANPSEPVGNGGKDFPWALPGGTHTAKNIKTIKFVYLPKPIVWFRRTFNKPIGVSNNVFTNFRTFKGYYWIYPKDTVFGELLLIAHKGEYYPFELRLRERLIYDWDVSIFRPFPTAESLAMAIIRTEPSLANLKLAEKLIKDDKIYQSTLSDKNHPIRAINLSAGTYHLPEINEYLAKKLLNNPVFYNCVGIEWKMNEKETVFAPTYSGDGLNIVPKNYTGGLLGNSTESCTNCHKDTTKHVQYFDYSRDWYGLIPGSDGILSFNIVDPSAVSHNGKQIAFFPNRRLERLGLLERYNPRKHDDRFFMRIPMFYEGR